MIFSKNITNFGFKPVTYRHQLKVALNGASVGDKPSPTEMKLGQQVTVRNRLDWSCQLVTDRYQLVTNCNQLTSEVGHIRKYPQIAETYPQTTTTANTLNTQQALDLLII